MKLRDLRIGWRVLVREPAYSAVVVCGLALGFAACFLLLGLVRYSMDYDSHVPDAARVFVVKQRINVFPRPEWQTLAGLGLRDAALHSGMPLQASIVKELETPLQLGGRLHKVDLYAVDPAFQHIFGIAPLQGDLAAALTRPDGLALTARTALRLFGRQPALGQLVRVGEAPLRVQAILPDPPANTTRPYEALTGSGSAAWPEPQRSASFAKRGRAEIYVRAGAGVSAAALTRALQDATDRSPQEAMVRDSAMGKSLAGRRVTDIALQSLPQVYFDADLAASRAGKRYGDKGQVFGLAGVALLILLLAATNYVNLATVRTLRRQREIGVRKLLGAGAARLARQFLAESALVALLATLAGLVLAWLALPLFAELLGRTLEGFFTPARCAAALAFCLATGLLAGAYPAWSATRVRLGQALAGRGGEAAGGLYLRRVLTVLQFAAAMALSGSTLAIAWQADYASHAHPGFDPDGLLVLDLPPKAEPAGALAFAEALARLPGVRGVAGSPEAVGRDGKSIVAGLRRPDGDTMRIEMKPVSPAFFEVYRVAPLAGRLFDPALDRADSAVAVVNTAAALALGYPDAQAAVGQILPAEGTAPARSIVGVAPDLRYRTLREAVQPMLYLPQASPQVLTVRSAEAPAQARQRIEVLWRRYFPNDMPDIGTARAIFAANYAEDQRLAAMLGVASLIAVALAAFGIYVLSAYSVQRRRREIVLRKLHGAGRGAIGRLLGREFAGLIGIGAALGLPLAALANERYLAGFVERAPIGLWPLPAALALAALVAALATARHTVAALRLAPLLALRD
ncbi:ABC transporter permease [Janthinobacterium fluminis]|uniref:ABC transporter permease n=1 Tax=Janthinobacterium fluminis TaxID=2987524 RepID=A0ABT5JZ22_9BURK|nr:ABC transporter permease [Janthinobacterium fluminis]MDC8757731.1 ABC transporter permease [Janthinobacterium fluminis]